MRPDEELVRDVLEAGEGDTLAFEELVRRHQASIVANCHYLTRSAEDAEDLAQEVFVKVFFKLSSFEGRARFRTWLQRVKVNHCLNHQKARRGRRFLDITEAEMESHEALQTGDDAAVGAEAREERAHIREVLESMPDSLRIPLVLSDVDGLSLREIADALELSLSAVKMRVSRARRSFRLQYATRVAEPAVPASREGPA